MMVFPVYGQGVSEQLYANESGGLSPELQRVRTLIRANVLDLARELLESGAPPAPRRRHEPNTVRVAGADRRHRTAPLP